MLVFQFISGSETIFIVLIVIMLFGADKIPEIARGLGKGLRQLRDITNEVKRDIINPKTEVKKHLNSSGIDKDIMEIKEELEEIGKSVKRNTKL